MLFLEDLVLQERSSQQALRRAMMHSLFSCETNPTYIFLLSGAQGDVDSTALTS